MYQGLKPEQAAVVQRAADLSRELFAKRAEQHDRTGKFPLENYADLHKAGLLGLTVPKEYGGVGADWVTFALTMLEIAKGCSATALTFNMHAVILDFIAQLGTEEQKRRWFGEVIDRGKLFSSITSEPQASFRHKFVLSTTFAPVEGGFLLSGVKHFGSLGEHASFHFVTALIEGTTTATEGQQSALVPAGSTGISVDRNWDAVGMRATSSDTIKYDKCFVRREDCLGGIAALSTIDITGFALGYSAIYLGIGEAAFHVAALVAGRFSVVTTLGRSIPAIEFNLLKYGLAARCGRVRAAEVPVLALEDRNSDARRRIEVEIEAAKREDRAEAIVLGCAGMVDLAAALSARHGLPVVDGVTAAVVLIESLVRLGLATSKVGGYAAPLPKVVAGLSVLFPP